MTDDLMLSNGNVGGSECGSELPSSVQKAGSEIQSDSLTMTPNSYGNTRAAMVPSDTKPVETLQTDKEGRVLMAHGGPSKVENWDVAIVNINSCINLSIGSDTLNASSKQRHGR